MNKNCFICGSENNETDYLCQHCGSYIKFVRAPRTCVIGVFLFFIAVLSGGAIFALLALLILFIGLIMALLDGTKSLKIKKKSGFKSSIFKKADTQQAMLLKYQDELGLDFSNTLEINSFLIGVDNQNKKLIIIPQNSIELKPEAYSKENAGNAYIGKIISEKTVHCIDYKDIIGLEIKRNEETITKAGLGMPIAGGILFGGAGAITGSIIGAKTTSDKSKISLLLQLNNFERSTIEIPVVQKEDFQFVKDANIAQLDKLCVWLKLILQENEQAQVQSGSNTNISSLDELEKLASLKDKGIITEEEFSLKKKQLLGL